MCNISRSMLWVDSTYRENGPDVTDAKFPDGRRWTTMWHDTRPQIAQKFKDCATIWQFQKVLKTQRYGPDINDDNAMYATQ